MKFEDALDIVLRHEGGFVNHPKDPGAATNLGVTIATLTRWRGNRPTTAEDVKALTVEDVRPIYKSWYWDLARCGDLPDGVDLLIFDCAVNQGPTNAARFLQQAVDVPVDGIIGPGTLSAVNAAAGHSLVKEIAVRRAVHYARLDATFRLGWYRRLFAVYREALSTT